MRGAGTRSAAPTGLTGGPRSERRPACSQQVKIVHARVELDRPKGGKSRTVPLPDAVAEALAEHLRTFPAGLDGLVFTSREHKPINRNHFNR